MANEILSASEGGMRVTIEQLEHLRGLSGTIQYYDEMAERLRSRAERLTTTLSGLPHGERQEMADIIAQIVDNERKAAERVIDLRNECEGAERWIETLPEQQQRVMRAYYIEGAKTWQDVAKKMPYSYIHCLRIKQAAVEKLENDSIC